MKNRIDPDRIVYAVNENFKDEKNTTVRTCGGEPDAADNSRGRNGWDYPGNKEGLKRAIDEAAKEIEKAKPKREQFILFVSDHGDGERLDEFERRQKAEKNSKTSLSDPFRPFEKGSSYAHHILSYPPASPGFAISLDFGHSPLKIRKDALGAPMAFYKQGDLELEITLSNGDVILLNRFTERHKIRSQDSSTFATLQ